MDQHKRYATQRPATEKWWGEAVKLKRAHARFADQPKLQILVSSFIGCVTLGKFLDFFECLHL